MRLTPTVCLVWKATTSPCHPEPQRRISSVDRWRPSQPGHEGDLIAQLLQHYGLALATLVVFAAELDVPTIVPVEVVLLLTGAYLVHSPGELLSALALLAAADFAGTLALYAAARRGGGWLRRALLRAGHRRLVRRFAEWHGRLGGHDLALVLLGHLVPGLRMGVAPGAGLLDVPPRIMVLGTLPGALLWVGIPLGLGYAFQREIDRLVRWAGALDRAALIAVLVALAALALAWWLRRQFRERRAHDG
ncbi:MAG TPA: VTT domain-containing protein [Thermomicrobiaceae bacterium]|nr:VTT domain-containing protein [Thermomicrobiaceae bacterium]